MRKRLSAVVSGDVQGVGFRYYVRAEADRLNLDGWVRNNYNDSTVETVAEGGEKGLKILLEALKRGSPFSRVDQVTEKWSEPGAPLKGFSIK